MPRKTRISPLDYARAVDLFGEEVLRTAAGSPQTLSNWRARGVPADVALPLVLAKYGPREHRAGAVREADAVYHDPADLIAVELRRHPEDLEWVRGLLTILRLGGERRRLGIESNIEAFLGDMGVRRARDAG